MPLRRLALVLTLICAPLSALAHPHEFVEAELALRFDPAGRLVAIDVAWHYDPFTSMLILSDLGLDPAVTDLAPEAAPALQGFDMDWIEGYNGDLWPDVDGQPVGLSAPVPGPAAVVGGQIVTRHRRDLLTPLDPRAGALRIRVFDPEFYIAYTIAVPVRIDGDSDCRARVYGPDLEAARAQLEAALDELSGSVDIELEFPRVGEHFADEVVLDCPPRSVRPQM